jgi:hypothetical protein
MPRQTGSDTRLTTQEGGEHHPSVPNHRPLKVGLPHAWPKDVAAHHGCSVEQQLKEIGLWALRTKHPGTSHWPAVG